MCKLRIPPIAINILLLVCSLLFALIVSEVLFRAFRTPVNGWSQKIYWDPVVFSIGAPNKEWTKPNPEFTTQMRTNSLGFRDDAFPTEAPRVGERRILFLGDSFTMAAQVEEDERFTELLQDSLPETHRIMNMGMDGAHLGQALAYYRHFGRSLKPDIVVHVIFIHNDLASLSDDDYVFLEQDGVLELKGLTPQKPRRTAATVFHSMHLHLLGRVAEGVSQRLRGQDGILIEELTEESYEDPEKAIRTIKIDYRYTKNGQQYLQTSRSWEATMAVLRTLKEEVEADGSRLIILPLPAAVDVHDEWGEELQNKYADAIPEQEWAIDGFFDTFVSYLQEGNFSVINPKAALEEAADEQVLYYPQDRHLTVEGHRVVADVMEGYFVSD